MDGIKAALASDVPAQGPSAQRANCHGVRTLKSSMPGSWTKCTGFLRFIMGQISVNCSSRTRLELRWPCVAAPVRRIAEGETRIRVVSRSSGRIVRRATGFPSPAGRGQPDSRLFCVANRCRSMVVGGRDERGVRRRCFGDVVSTWRLMPAALLVYSVALRPFTILRDCSNDPAWRAGTISDVRECHVLQTRHAGEGSVESSHAPNVKPS